MLYDEIKAKNIEAMKQRNTDARAIYSVLIGKLDLVKVAKREKQEELTDTDCISVIQKTLKELEDEKGNYQKVGNVAKVEALVNQMNYAKSFLPSMLSEEEIVEIVNSLEDKSLPNIMKYFKTNYAGKCDMGLVNKVAKGLN